MRIVFISRVAPPNYSGAGRRVFNYAKHLQKDGHDVVYLSGQFSSDLPRCETIQGVSFVRFPVSSSSLFSTFIFHLQCALWLFRHQGSYDIIHMSNMPKFFFPVLFVAKLLGKVVYVTMTLYGSDDLPSIRKRKLGRLRLWLFHQCDGIIAISERLIQVSVNYWKKEQPLIHIPWTIDLNKFSPSKGEDTRSRLREHYGIPKDRPVSVFSGSVIERKGVDLLIKAWHDVVKALPDALLFIVGPRSLGVYKFPNDIFSKRLDAMIRDLELESNVVFTGEKANDKVPDYLRIANVFTFPSRMEGFGGAIVEAMAVGLPVVVCEQPWLPENLVRHNQTGLVTEPTVESIAESIIYLLTNPEIAQRMGEEARREAERKYAPDKVIAQLIDIYSFSLDSK